MNKIVYSVLLLLLCWACDSNEIKMFGSSDANVYFPEPKIGVAVGNIVSVPVTLANFRGEGAIDIRVRFEDSTAVYGEDYIVHSGETYCFERGAGTLYVVVEAIAKVDDNMTNRVFSIVLEEVDGLRKNVRNTMLVEIHNYSKHPLKNLLGDAVFTGADLVQNNIEASFPVSIYPDETDATTLWLSGMTGGLYKGVLPDLQLAVDTVHRTITIPYQSFPSRSLGGKTGTIESFRGIVQNNTFYIEEKSDVILRYDKDGNIYFQDWFGMWWTSGSENGQPLFIYYGNYGGGYNSMILKPKK